MKPSRTLGTRVALPAGIFTLASVVVLSFVLIRAQREQVLREVVHGSENIAEAILLSLDRDMQDNSREGVEELIEALGRHEDIETIRIFNKDGAIAFSSRPEEVGRRVDRKAEACVQCHVEGRPPNRQLTADNRARRYKDANGKPLLASIHVIANTAGCAGADCHAPAEEQSVLGVLDVAMSLEHAETRLATATRSAAMLSIGAAGLITLIVFLVIRQSVKIEKLGATKQQLEQMAATLQREVALETEQLKQANYQVIQAEKLSSVGLVAAGIAHELNSPLMAIITFSHLVRNTMPPEGPAQDDLRMIEREANRCAVIIRQLLDYSRKQTAEPEMRPCNIRHAIDGALELLKVERQNMGVTVQIDIEDELPDVEANDLQLMQVFMNLMLNALQAMPDGGELSISAHAVERRLYEHLELPPHASTTLVRIVVRDSGSGIKQTDLARVFDPFFTTKPVGKGSGLGLSVSMGLVQQYHGTILADSDGKSWTEFTVLLPSVKQPALVGV